jgi:hypothetical protein
MKTRPRWKRFGSTESGASLGDILGAALGKSGSLGFG